jgi:hypothetical protein
MKENTYTAFINEYKEGLGKEGFDITEHFNQRKKLHLLEVRSIGLKYIRHLETNPHFQTPLYL